MPYASIRSGRSQRHKCRCRMPVSILSGSVLFCAAARLQAAQPLETETARLMKGGRLRVESTGEFQTSAEGGEEALPMAIEYGILDNLELAVEPVWLTTIHPKVGRGATGLGDTEATLAFRFVEERAWLPALAVAAEVKIPTAKDKLIGTGEYDYTGYLIASKRYGNFQTHLNFGYTIVGQPGGVHLKNMFDFALAEEWHVIPKKFDLVAEILGNTASAPESPEGTASTSNENQVSPEAAGGEVVGMVGARYYVGENFFASLGVTYDNNQAVMLRPGFTWWIDGSHSR